MRKGLRSLLVGLLIVSSAVPALAQAPIKFTLPFSFQGALSAWTLAYADGCYKRNGLDVTIDAGSGSGDVLTKVAAGAYDIALADFTNLITFVAQHPEAGLVGTFVMVDSAPSAVVVLKKSRITRPEQLAGKRIGDNVGEASRELFPAFARANGFDPASVTWINIAANLRQASLARGYYEAAAGTIWALTSGLEVVGIRPDDYLAMPYAKWGADFLGNTLTVKASWAAQNARSLKAFITCGIDGLNHSIRDPKAAVDSLKRFNSLLDEQQALYELNLANQLTILTDNVKKNGFSSIDAERLRKDIDQAADALALKNKPTPDKVWNAAYLPPASLRRVAIK